MAILYRKNLDKFEEEDMSFKNHYTPDGLRLIQAFKDFCARKEEYFKERGSVWERYFGTASFITESGGGAPEVTLGAACSARFQSRQPKHLIYLVNRAYEGRTQIDTKIVDAYYKWLMNDSNWAPAFRTKKPLYAKRYGMEMETSAHGGLVYGATIAVRVWEYPSIPISWYAMVKKGVNPNLAFIVAHYLHLDGDNFSVSEQPIHTGHTVVNVSDLTSGIGTLKSFVHGPLQLPSGEKDKFYSDKVSVNRFGAHATFMLGEMGKQLSFKGMLIRWAKECNVKTTTSLNPFRSTRADAEAVSAPVDGLSNKLKEFGETLRGDA